MVLTNTDLKFFVDKIRLKPEDMPKYRDQVKRLTNNLEERIKNDKRTGLKVTRAVISGSWKKHTILRPTGDTPIILQTFADISKSSLLLLKKTFN